MARRYIGDAIVSIRYVGGRDDEYAGFIKVPGKGGARAKTWRFDSLHAPKAGLKRGVAYDSASALDQMAAAAVSFGSYYQSGNRGEGRHVPAWVPKAAVADAISAATVRAMRGRWRYAVRRRADGKERLV